MLLVIENKDDPIGFVAEETKGDAGLAYIPVITVPVERDPRQLNLECIINRFCYRQRNTEPAEPPTSQQIKSRVPLFLKAVGRTGCRPDYLTPGAERIAGTALPLQKDVRLYSRG